MPTQDERLVTLEQFRTETLLAYKDMAFQVTMTKGLTEDAIGRLAVLQRDVAELKAQINARLDTITDELNAHTLLLHQILDRLPPAKE